MIPGAFNALTAKLAERLGFAAVYLSGGALSAGWAGLPDIGLLTQTEFAERAAVLARATALPLLCDADTGFGEAVNVERAVRLFEEVGAADPHLEDQVLPKRCGHLSRARRWSMGRRWSPSSAPQSPRSATRTS
jgi:methylisocitrate lyase